MSTSKTTSRKESTQSDVVQLKIEVETFDQGERTSEPYIFKCHESSMESHLKNFVGLGYTVHEMVKGSANAKKKFEQLTKK